MRKVSWRIPGLARALARASGLALGLALGLTGTGAAVAQATTGTVVELYTSQGCSSCPPADDYLMRLAQEKGVIALALHVDYWDYLGWKDDYGHEAFTRRQRDYAAAMGLNMIYTPQMVVAGADQGVGSDPGLVAGFIRQHQAEEQAAELDLRRQGDVVVIRARARAGLQRPVIVQLVRFLPHAEVDIRSGENAGKTIDYANIVTSWKKIGTWDGVSDLDLTAEAKGDQAIVVILQDEGPGPIRAAAVLR